jgi:hypothetical protein
MRWTICVCAVGRRLKRRKKSTREAKDCTMKSKSTPLVDNTFVDDDCIVLNLRLGMCINIFPIK